MKDAIGYAQKKAEALPDYYRYRHYCVIQDKRGRIIAEAGNSYETTHPVMHEVSKKFGMDRDFVHAEALAIIRSKGKGCKLTVVRVGRDGGLLMSKPCPICDFLIKQHNGITSVEYSVGRETVEELHEGSNI